MNQYRMSLVREGFWRSSEEPDLPMPVAGDMADRAGFLAALAATESMAAFTTYKGCSNCRVCGRLNGDTDYMYAGFVWPSGYRHYIADHGVVPTRAFELMIRAQA